MPSVVKQVLKYVKLPFEGPLRDFQIEDLEYFPLLDLAGWYWDMGLGKSVAGAITGGWKLLKDKAETVVVLAPAALGAQWSEMLTTMGFKTLWYVGTPARRMKLNIDVDFLVCSFEIFQKDYDRLSRINRPFFIVDEATVLCNSQNLLWKMLNGGIVEKKKPKQPTAGRTKKEKIQYPKILYQGHLLTGTPINKPIDAYGLIKIVSPDIYPNYTQFCSSHIDTLDFFGGPKTYRNLDLLRQNLAANATIRKVEDHLNLPEKIYNIIEYDLAPDHYKLYQELLETRMIELEGEIKIEALQAMQLYNWAQKLILNPEHSGYKKDPIGLELLDSVVADTRQLLIVNKYTITNAKVLERYAKIGIGGCYGEISRPKQTKYVEEFKRRNLRLLALHPKSGGFGLNLQVCNQVIFPELPVTAREFRQSESRVWRQGQEERVIVTLLIARRTIQQKLLREVMNRDDVTREVIPTITSLRKDLFGN